MSHSWDKIFCPKAVFLSTHDGHLGCFHILAIVNNAAMNVEVLMFFQSSVGSFRYIPRSGITGSKGRSFFFFFFYTTEYYSAVKKRKILPSVTVWMDLENIMLSE